MEVQFEPASMQDVHAVFALYEHRVAWMNEKGIRQWNVTSYLEAYPVSYYAEQQRLGHLFVLRSAGRTAGAVVLLEEDERWADRPGEAYYVHNLVTDPSEHGAGSVILAAAEKLALQRGKHFMRLDCAVDNSFLNSHYEAMGYVPAGYCEEGKYKGIRREKKLT